MASPAEFVRATETSSKAHKSYARNGRSTRARRLKKGARKGRAAMRVVALLREREQDHASVIGEHSEALQVTTGIDLGSGPPQLTKLTVKVEIRFEETLSEIRGPRKLKKARKKNLVAQYDTYMATLRTVDASSQFTKHWRSR